MSDSLTHPWINREAHFYNELKKVLHIQLLSLLAIYYVLLACNFIRKSLVNSALFNKWKVELLKNLLQGATEDTGIYRPFHFDFVISYSVCSSISSKLIYLLQIKIYPYLLLKIAALTSPRTQQLFYELRHMRKFFRKSVAAGNWKGVMHEFLFEKH